MTYIVIATKEELPLIEYLPERVRDYPVIITGVGGANVVTALQPIPRESLIINIGYAGSLDMEIGSVHSVGKCSLVHDVPCRDREFNLGGDCICYTSSNFHCEAKRGCLYDMELAYICALGFYDVRSIKVVSDHCNYNQYLNTIKNSGICTKK